MLWEKESSISSQDAQGFGRGVCGEEDVVVPVLITVAFPPAPLDSSEG